LQEFRALLAEPFRIVTAGGEEFTLSDDLILTVLGKLSDEKEQPKTDSTKELSNSSDPTKSDGTP